MIKGDSSNGAIRFVVLECGSKKDSRWYVRGSFLAKDYRQACDTVKQHFSIVDHHKIQICRAYDMWLGRDLPNCLCEVSD